MKRRLYLVAAGLFAAALGSCAGLPTATLDESAAAVPPETWDAAFAFVIPAQQDVSRTGYGVRIIFFDGVRTRGVDGRSVIESPYVIPQTPWYRVRPRAALSTTLRITIEHANGARTNADYPITVRPDEFYQFNIGVGQVIRDDRHPATGVAVRGYPVNPAAGVPATDSLWIGYTKRGRNCFDCPT
jgi:hypothetical protein